jgi:hypothetical protein
MRLTCLSLCLLCVLLATAHARDSAAAAGSTPEILVTSFHARQWQVRYDFAVPVTRMLFARSPDDSRTRTWTPDQGFEIVATDAGEVARRKDGATFRTVRFRLSPHYRALPNDYGPFAPFGDGGMLFHSGRFFACAEACPAQPAWSLTLWASPDDRIVLDGVEQRGQAQWTDRDEGRAVYVGSGVATQTRDMIALVDEALPAAIRSQLLRQLPAFMQLYSQKLGRVARRPMLFVSYDVSPYEGEPERWGSQGGVLPGQVFIHFYGARWPEKIATQSVADYLSWHFAHEAAHVYQSKFATDPAGHWIHEGAAEAIAAMTLRSLDTGAAAYAQSKIEGAKGKCATQLGGRTMLDALTAGTPDVAYSCGLLLHLELDAQIRRTTHHDGIYAVWREYAKSKEPSERAYLAAISAVGKPELAEWTRSIVRNSDPAFQLDPPIHQE